MTQTILPPANSPEETLQKIRRVKLNHISCIFNNLLLQEEAEKRFKDLPDEHDYLNFLGKFHTWFDRYVQGDPPLIAEEPETWSPEFAAEMHKNLYEIGQAMQRIDYYPPKDRAGELMHLKAMWHLYNEDFNYPPTIEDCCLDLAFSKLIVRVQQNLMIRALKGKQDKPRTKKSSATKTKKANLWKSFVLAIYEYGEPIPSGTGLSKAIVTIQNQFEQSRGNKEAIWGEIPKDKKKMPTRGRDSIIAMLKAEGILESDFEKKGSRWYKKM